MNHHDQWRRNFYRTPFKAATYRPRYIGDSTCMETDETESLLVAIACPDTFSRMWTD
ncbi:hypothetical protein QJS10_CPA05g01825 [Acorus calamus]|uniref:Uncharacterized protein n=1 Tax=Acorus calamus TaxID=4465 RepID=A0AAV9EV33_ACOCL|nr:hypothetical protein QJS10_CPA05g01825 [Acorus calamus]